MTKTETVARYAVLIIVGSICATCVLVSLTLTAATIMLSWAIQFLDDRIEIGLSVVIAALLGWGTYRSWSFTHALFTGKLWKEKTGAKRQ